jgi:hypothetical protein
LSLPVEARTAIGRRLSDEIHANHSVKQLAAKLEEVFRAAIRRRRGPTAAEACGPPAQVTVRDKGPARP